MFDLRNKNIYVGSQKIASAYLGERLIHGQPSMVQPVDHTGSIIAVNVQNGEMNEYVNTTPNNAKVLNRDSNFTASGVTPTISDNCVVLKDQAIVVNTGLRAARHDFYVELTFKTSTLLAKRYAYYLANSFNTSYFSVESMNPLPSYRPTIGSGSGTTQPIPETEYVTFSMTSDSNEGKFYVNGSLSETLTGRATASEYLLIGSGISYGRIGTAFDRIDIVDFKWGITVPSEAQIVANYQNIQERLNNI